MSNEIKHINWVDGAKGVAILSVILQHCIPCSYEIGWMWHIGQAVPIFLFITAYLITKRFESFRTYYTWNRFTNMIKKIILPFMIVLLIQIVLLAVVNGVPSLKTIIKNTGIGPGSYYPWLYVQVWLIMPLIVVFVRKVPIWLSFLIMLFISIIAEYIFVPIENVEHVEELYRILPARYLMIFYLGCIWPILKDKQKYIFYSLAGISALMILNDLYLPENMQVANILMGGDRTFVLERISLVYCFLCTYTNGDIGKNTLFGSVDTSR